MPVLRMIGHPLVKHASGKVALQRGPFVYCHEGADNGPRLHQIVLPKESDLSVQFDPEYFGGMNRIEAQAYRIASDDMQNKLYKEEAEAGLRADPVAIRFVPYFTWANRGAGEMAVWIREM